MALFKEASLEVFERIFGRFALPDLKMKVRLYVGIIGITGLADQADDLAPVPVVVGTRDSELQSM